MCMTSILVVCLSIHQLPIKFLARFPTILQYTFYLLSCSSLHHVYLLSQQASEEITTRTCEGRTFVAQCDFESCSDDVLSFKKGDEFNIISTDGGDKWLAYSQSTGKKGYIYSDYITEVTYPVHAALYDYEPHADDDLMFKKGDLLCIINGNDGDWWFARSKRTGKEGYAPSNYLTSSAVKESATEDEIYPVYMAKCDYKACSDDELSFKKGEEFSIISTGEGDRWLAFSQSTGKKGYISSNCLTGAIYPIHAALYDYESRTDEDLSFEKGDLLCVINTDDNGWWFARSKKSGKEGYIPSNYLTSCVVDINNSLNIHK